MDNCNTKYISATHAQLEWGHSRCLYNPLATAKAKAKAKTITRFETTPFFVGASLLAKQATRSSWPTPVMPSRAGSLPQRTGGVTDPDTKLARLPPRTPLIRPSRLARNTSPVLDREQSVYRISVHASVFRGTSVTQYRVRACTCTGKVAASNDRMRSVLPSWKLPVTRSVSSSGSQRSRPAR